VSPAVTFFPQNKLFLNYIYLILFLFKNRTYHCITYSGGVSGETLRQGLYNNYSMTKQNFSKYFHIFVRFIYNTSFVDNINYLYIYMYVWINILSVVVRVWHVYMYTYTVWENNTTLFLKLSITINDGQRGRKTNETVDQQSQFYYYRCHIKFRRDKS
jgi:hypothetical protein